MRHALTGCLLRGLMILLVFSSSASSQTTATAQINGIGTVITNEQVLELLLNGRQLTELVFQAGLATGGKSGSDAPGGGPLNSGVRVSSSLR